MAQVLSLNLLHSSTRPDSPGGLQCLKTTRFRQGNQSCACLPRHLKCNGKFSCLFSDNRKKEEAKKALESALGGKKSEFERWNKEIKRREEVGSGSDGGGGGWFGWGGRFGWSNGDNFWQEAQQTSLAVLGIILMYLVVAKGEMMLAVVFNPLLSALRGARDGFTFILSKILRNQAANYHANIHDASQKQAYVHVSSKEKVVRKWGSD